MQDLSTLQQGLTTIVTTPSTALLLLVLLAAAVIDARSYRIPNALTVPGMVLGLVVGAVGGATVTGGLLNALAGLGVALLCLIPLHALRAIGAGDVKLMAVVGAFLGVPDVLPAMFFVVFAGGVMATAFVLYHRVAGRMVANVALMLRSLALAAWTRTPVATPAMVSSGRLPYALCILAGTTVFLVVRQGGI
jgi:prepilin peptidase CpaA